MDLKARQTIRRTISVEEAASMLGISRAKAYECARQGELPSLRFGRRVVVPLAELERMLGSAIAEDE
jgi:excisionase family DNA binding protein